MENKNMVGAIFSLFFIVVLTAVNFQSGRDLKESSKNTKIQLTVLELYEPEKNEGSVSRYSSGYSPAKIILKNGHKVFKIELNAQENAAFKSSPIPSQSVGVSYFTFKGSSCLVSLTLNDQELKTALADIHCRQIQVK